MWLEIENLNVSNSSKIIFENASLQSDSNLTVIYGANGIGKSTLFNVLYKYKPYEGSVSFYDLEIKGLSKRNISKTISYVMQEPMLYPDLTVKANLKILGINDAEFYRYYEQFTLKPLLEKKFGQLSGGEKQAIALSIGFAKECKCVLLDEPINNLSNKNKQILIDIISCEKRNVIIISHEQLVDVEADVVNIEGRGFNV